MVRIDITKHAYDRMKQRLGWNKKAAKRMAGVAYAEGIKHGETNGKLHSYISSRALTYMKKGNCIKIYGEAVYCFVNRKDDETGELFAILITVWNIPWKYRSQVLGIQRRKKDRVS